MHLRDTLHQVFSELRMFNVPKHTVENFQNCFSILALDLRIVKLLNILYLFVSKSLTFGLCLSFCLESHGQATISKDIGFNAGW
jgi:hypothetical protein